MNTRVRATIVVAVMLAAACGLVETVTDITGKWYGEVVTTEGQTDQWRFDLTHDDDKLAGTFSLTSVGMGAVTVSGTVTGTFVRPSTVDMTYDFTIPELGTFDCAYAGTLTEMADSISGMYRCTFMGQQVSAELNLARQP